MSGSGHPTDSPLKVKKVRIWKSGGRRFATWSAILNPHRYMPKLFFDGSQDYIRKLGNEMRKIPLR